MKREAGMTLIELIVAMAVTLVITAATLSLFSSAMRTNEGSTQLSNMNGNLRSAMSLISRDLLQAGQGIPTGGVPIPAGTGCRNLNRPVSVGTATFPYACGAAYSAYPNLPAVVPGNGLGPAVPGTAGNLGSPTLTWVPSPGPTSDMVTMMYQDNTLITGNIVTGPVFSANYLTAITTSSMTFSSATNIAGAVTPNGLNNQVLPGDIFMITGKTATGPANRYVVVTNVSGQTVNFTPGDPNDALLLNQQGTAATGTVGDLQMATGCPQPAASPNPPYSNPPPAACVATAQRVLMISYWLDITQSVNGVVIPRLMRQVNLAPSAASCLLSPPPLNGCPRSVAEVIEGFELSYDYVNGTVPVNNQVSSTAAATACSCTISDNQIRKVNLYIAGRSDNPLTTTNQYLRNNIATQIDLRSLAFVNRYQ